MKQPTPTTLSPKALFFLFLCISFLQIDIAAQKKHSYEMSFEELSQTTFVSQSSLTTSNVDMLPATITLITREMIERSGARNLDELLDIYVPDFQLFRQATTGYAAGIRGVNGAITDKLLLLVNGKNMNDRTLFGAWSERFISMLGDIDYIEVIRNPVSALYGSGAISGVISIRTLDSQSFEGMSIKVRQGAIEYFSNMELRLAHKFDEQSGLFFYYGVDDYRGARQKYSPAFSSATLGNGIIGNTHIRIPLTADYSAYRNQLRHKAHLQFDHHNFRTWLRYTRGGVRSMFAHIALDTIPVVEGGYQQLSWLAENEHQLSSSLRLNWRLDYDVSDIEQIRRGGQTGRSAFSYLEQEYHARVLLNYRINKQHELSIGYEFSRESFGKPGIGFPGSEAAFGGFEVGEWYTNTHSLLSEYQWYITDDLMMLTGLRADKHTLTPWTLSPRLVFIYQQNDSNQWKLLYNRSNRRSSDFFLRVQELTTGTEGDVETIDQLELSLEQEIGEAYTLHSSLYYSKVELIDFASRTTSTFINEPVGEAQHLGLTMSLKSESEKWRWVLSHSYTQLLKFDPLEATTNSISSEPYGYGHDYANWGTHISKFHVFYDINEHWRADASLRYHWGFPGAEDYTAYNRNEGGNTYGGPLSDASDNAFAAAAHLNFGVDYQSNSKWRWRLEALNVMGWINQKYNKRNSHGGISSEYRMEAAAFSMSLEYNF
ncbi:MAG: TonB-dependent receptor plug domain-containing protein [Lentisphaeraceae bacterium]|nr:TonB-dependent receptor plug domain-containing protein [Lentisphaeraceae bacterium]